MEDEVTEREYIFRTKKNAPSLRNVLLLSHNDVYKTKQSVKRKA